LITNYIKSLKLDDKIIEVKNTDNKKVFPEATVIIVTYNTNQKLLSQNLDSLKKQLNNNFEIIIVDNSDKADVKQIISSYRLKYSL
jgi:cellulose synthase/poly-beta-1,6-N-acetylglucosamine synthase-like glycosyltransferase